MKLFAGEKVEFHRGDSLEEHAISDEDINAKYVRGEIRIVTEQARYPLSSVPEMLKGEGYILNPEYQRRRRWDVVQKSKLIESFIMNVPIPPIFLYEIEYSRYEVMDGLQRLSAVREFYSGEFALEGLEEWSELNGKTYRKLPEQVRRGIDRRYISSIILLQETAKSLEQATELKQLVFERINSGGTKLEDQETRNAIYRGPLNTLCLKLSRTKHLCRTWAIPEPTPDELLGGEPSQEVLKNERFKKMEDVELVLRFFAYRQRRDNQRGAFKSFLDEYLERGNFFAPDVLSRLDGLFTDTIKIAYELFGERAFWLYRKREGKLWNWYRRPTTVVYDPMMFALSQLLPNSGRLLDKKAEINAALVRFYQGNYDIFEGRYTNRANLAERNEKFAVFFSGFVE